ncbi:MAG: (2Fe-2S)-binding protein [Vicinamibacterales bacterium]
MSDCCCQPPVRPSAAHCPACGNKGLAVALQTVKAMLLPQALQRLDVTDHRFCPTARCEVVYFDDAGHTFCRADVRVPVWHKEPFGRRVVCYCFGETETIIREELEHTGSTQAEERVRRHIAATRCACDIRNPKGSCCLGDLMAAVMLVEVALLTKAE